MSEHLFTSESVSEGHPDKVADQISDAVLDAVLMQDPIARVACETMITTGMVLVSGEITTIAWVDIPELVRGVLHKIGYTASSGFDPDSCAVLTSINKQSPDIKMGVDTGGAGDQGLMFGYAVAETDQYMPLPITLAHNLMKRHSVVRKRGILTWLRPDAKSQVTMLYNEKGYPVKIDTIVLSSQHAPEISHKQIEEGVMEEIIKPVLKDSLYENNSFKTLVNPTGSFIIGGPAADCGLTGRKIIVDTYGGSARHGGGAFSGKDPSKVDRSAAYAARHAAKNVVAAEMADKCEVQLAYAIGVPQPISVNVNTFGTGKLTDAEITNWIRASWSFTPQHIISRLRLLEPIYFDTASNGHFGNPKFTWEILDETFQNLEW